MPKPLNEQHADAARRALDAVALSSQEKLPDRIFDLLIGIAHLCDAEQLEFLPIAEKAIGHWAIERFDPASVLKPPSVAIFIDRQGLPPLPERKKHR